MSRTLAEFLRDGEDAGRVLRSHASKVAAPNAKQLVYSRKITGKTEGKKKMVGSKRAPAGLAAEQEKKPKKSTTKKRTTVVVPETAEVSSTLGVKSTSAARSSTRAWQVSLSSADAVAEAMKHLLAADPKFEYFVKKYGMPEFHQDGSSFFALARSVVYQQLSGKAADTIFGRLIELCGGLESVTPAVVTALSAEELRAIGISARKEDHLCDLADKFLSGALSDEKFATMSDDDLMSTLTALKSIGVWSAQMFMVSHLHKPDVLPLGDSSIRKGFQKLYELKKLPSASEMEELALSWRPYRTLATWYFWRMHTMTSPSDPEFSSRKFTFLQS